MLTVPPAVTAVLDPLPDGHSLYEFQEAGGQGRLMGVYMNPAGLQLRGLTQDAFLGACLLERTRAVGNAHVAQLYLDVLETGTTLRRHLVTDDLIGQDRTFELNAAKVALDGSVVLSMWFRDVTHEIRARHRLQDAARSSAVLSLTDDLTGLPNRRAWQRGLRRAVVATEQAEARPVALAIADLDRFKNYNDEFGHLAGDQLLVDLATAWAAVLGPGQLLARLGGEEFGLLLPDLQPPAVDELCCALLAAVPTRQTASIGVAHWQPGERPETVLARADRLMYAAKDAGRNTVRSDRSV